MRPRAASPRARAWPGLALVGVLASGCRVSGLEFVRPDALRVDAPRQAAVVTLPLEVRWEPAEGVATAPPQEGRGHYYAVFVNRAPIAPGDSMLSAVTDELCRAQGFGCATPAYFAQNFVFLTAEPAVTIPAVPVGLNTEHKENVSHQISVILVGPDDRRVGETVGITSFHVRGRSSTGLGS